MSPHPPFFTRIPPYPVPSYDGHLFVENSWGTCSTHHHSPYLGGCLLSQHHDAELRLQAPPLWFLFFLSFFFFSFEEIDFI